MIYVMGESETGIVKIGTANNPCDRLKQIQTGYPKPLKLLLALPGGQSVEAALHRHYAPLRMSEREWFDFGDLNAVFSVMVSWAHLNDLDENDRAKPILDEVVTDDDTEIVQVDGDEPEPLPVPEPLSAGPDVAYTFRDIDGMQMVFTGPTERGGPHWKLHINPDLTSQTDRLCFGQATIHLESALDLAELRGMLDREIRWAKSQGLWPTQPEDSVASRIQTGMRQR